MRVDATTGLINGAKYIPSANFDTRPEGAAVDTLVIHAISLPPGEYPGSDIERLFCNSLDFDCHPFYQGIAGLTVSSHLLIRRDGEVLQFVPCQARAWHAGVSELQGRQRVNDFSIGIELEGSDHAPFEEAQYLSLVEVTRALRDAYPEISLERIVGHSEIAPGRKTDPGPYFNWARYRRALASNIQA
jgi:N-acetyl-anhydromuramoyl-L-alanine amidase